MQHTALLTALLLAATRLHAQAATVDPCPFTPAELKAAIGVTFQAGVAGQPIKAGSLTMQSCQYSSSRYSVRVGTTIYAQQADALQHLKVMLAGTKVPIPNDPDGAVFQEGQGDNTDPVVAYARKAVAVEIRILGIFYDDPSSRMATLRTLREKLAKLRRIP
ncbi:MAG: hypothetical protein MUF00_02435 [Gemmatimonadaceae bacterium]|jgi:hypothetical protein|nr:hypothetical protein [Gemmatimonadaceae bacterium]